MMMIRKGVNVLIGISVFAQLGSCCDDVFLISGIRSVNFYNSASGFGDVNETDSIIGPFRIDWELGVERTYSALVTSNAAFATSCNPNFRNSVLLDSTTLSCDRAIILNGGDTLLPNSDLTWLCQSEVVYNYGSAVLVYNFTQSVLNSIDLQNGVTTFRLHLVTDDGQELDVLKPVLISL